MQFNPELFGKKITVENGFYDLMAKLQNSDVHLPRNPEYIKSLGEQTSSNYKISKFEGDTAKFKLDLVKGHEYYVSCGVPIGAYDESIASYSALEGKAACVAHSLVYLYEGKYYPIAKITMLFSTLSRKIREQIPTAILATQYGKKGDPPSVDATINVEIANQKRKFLEENSFDNSILFIDGPFIAGDGLAAFRKIVSERFINSNIIPIFIVKNSLSTQLTDSFTELRGEYNSDLHFVNELLKPAERSSFYSYVDPENSENAKAFCYIKFDDRSSPIRVELPTEIYKQHLDQIDSLMNLILYFIAVQGDYINPQIRPIAIAEKYARETIKVADFSNNMDVSKLTATMNERRGFE